MSAMVIKTVIVDPDMHALILSIEVNRAATVRKAIDYALRCEPSLVEMNPLIHLDKGKGKPKRFVFHVDKGVVTEIERTYPEMTFSGFARYALHLYEHNGYMGEFAYDEEDPGALEEW